MARVIRSELAAGRVRERDGSRELGAPGIEPGTSRV
jgi:hypothetical protein